MSSHGSAAVRDGGQRAERSACTIDRVQVQVVNRGRRNEAAGERAYRCRATAAGTARDDEVPGLIEIDDVTLAPLLSRYVDKGEHRGERPHRFAPVGIGA